MVFDRLREHGWAVEYVDADGFTWASLVSIDDPGIRVERYGRGVDRASAAARAWQRYVTEQLGGSGGQS